MSSNVKKLLILGGLVVMIIMGYGIYKLSDAIVSKGYSSGKIVLENTPEDREDEMVLNSIDKVIGTKEGEYVDTVIPDKVYNEEASVIRSKEYLGDEYYTYETMFKEIVEKDDEPFKDLKYTPEYIITLDMLDKEGYFEKLGIAKHDVESIDDYTFADIGVDEFGAEAVYFYDGTKVIYKLDTKEPTFFVVDYSKSSITESTDLVELGGVFGRYLYIVPELCKKEEIDGYTVYFQYYTLVVKDW